MQRGQVLSLGLRAWLTILLHCDGMPGKFQPILEMLFKKTVLKISLTVDHFEKSSLFWTITGLYETLPYSALPKDILSSHSTVNMLIRFNNSIHSLSKTASNHSYATPLFKTILITLRNALFKNNNYQSCAFTLHIFKEVTSLTK